MYGNDSEEPKTKDKPKGGRGGKQRRQKGLGKKSSSVVTIVKKYEESKAQLEELMMTKEKIESEIRVLTEEVQKLREQLIEHFK